MAVRGERIETFRGAFGSLVAVSVLVIAAFAAPVAAQTSLEDARWLPWLGCWEPVGKHAADGLMCVLPADCGVEMLSVVDGEIVSTEILSAAGREYCMDREGCRGWRATRFSGDCACVHTASKHTCPGDPMRQRFGVGELGHNSADHLHLYAEAIKHAFWARLGWASDADVAPPPLDVLLGGPHWEGVAAGFDPTRANDFEPPFDGGADERHTTHFVVADSSPACSTFEPPGPPMDAHPGRRKLSDDVPLFVPGGTGRPWLLVATEPNTVAVECSIPDRMRYELARRGHHLREAGGIGNAHGLSVGWREEGRPVRFLGGADARGLGFAAGPGG